MTVTREEWLTEMIEILGVEREDILEVAGMFFDAIEERLNAMAKAHADGDMKELTRIVHGLKGDAANIGFKESSAIARSLETQCRDGELKDFETEFQALRDAVRKQKQCIGID